MPTNMMGMSPKERGPPKVSSAAKKTVKSCNVERLSLH